MTAWIGLGSNLEDPAGQVCSALLRLGEMESIEVVRTSGFYRTAPWGGVEQGDFINAVTVIETTFNPEHLLNTILEIEWEMGRERTGDRWGPRCIDLDLLTYNDMELQSPGLELPHPRMHLRAFVLAPVLELDPDFRIPGLGPAQAQLELLENQNVQRLGSAREFCNRMNTS